MKGRVHFSRRFIHMLPVLAAWFLSLACLAARGAENTYIYTVQLTAVVQEAPTSITLNWRADPYGVSSYVVYRKGKDEQSWGSPLATLDGSATSFQDTNVEIGGAYEYQVVKNASKGYRGYGYIYVGVLTPLSDNRGKIVLLVANESTAGLENELARLETDLTGDGWQVLRRGISSNSTPEQARAIIRNEYLQDPANVQAAFLLGHVPVLRSGYLNYDTHQTRSMPADAYYGEMDEDWPTDPTISPSFMPSDIELMVGRVDFSNMPGSGAAVLWPDERELLRRYLDKDHAWRHGLMDVPRRALMGNRRGDENGIASAASGYRAFEPIVGPGNVVEANIADSAPNSERWISMLGRDEYLIAYGCGGGLPQGISWLGTNGVYKEAWSRDVAAVDAKAVFVMLFGSWFAEWDKPDNFLRSFLVTSKGLAACMGGWPHWYMHHCALGEPLGYSARLTMNNSTLYTNQINGLARAVYISLMGDPTLRIDVVRPVSNVVANRTQNTVQVTWSPSPDVTAGVHIYRSTSTLGPFTRLTSNPVQGTTFTDNAPAGAASVYMVRAIRLENRFSGSYYNASEGITAVAPAAPPQISVSTAPGEIVLTWNSVPGTAYKVEGREPGQTAWSDLSSSIIATSDAVSWTNLVNAHSALLMRVRAQ